MRIRAVLDSKGTLSIQPDPVRVLVGEPLQWEFVSDYNSWHLSWTIYFEHSMPFGRGNPTRLFASSLRQSQQAIGAPAYHYAVTPSATAEDPGDHKYGVRVEDAASGKTLADDDPLLIILS